MVLYSAWESLIPWDRTGWDGAESPRSCQPPADPQPYPSVTLFLTSPPPQGGLRPLHIPPSWGATHT